MIMMAGPKQTYHHGDLRNALVQAAAQAIAEAGADGFSLRGVARSVGVSPNATYRHFKDKSALLSAVGQLGLERLAEQMRESQAKRTRRRSDPALEQFRATGRAYVDFAVEHPELFRLTFGKREGASIDEQPLSDPVLSPYAVLGKALDGLVEAQIIPAHNREGAELKAWSVVHGFTTLLLERGLTFPSERARVDAVESLLDFVVAGLGNKSAPA